MAMPVQDTHITTKF